jgi:cystathionine gamma-synthase
MRLSAGVNERLLRLSVGIEDVNDLIGDLEKAFKCCEKENGL